MSKPGSTGRDPGPGSPGGTESPDPDTAFSAALTAAMRWLAARARTSQEIRQRLTAGGFSTATVEAVLARLQGWGYVDDRRLAVEAVERAVTGRCVGPRRVGAELIGRGVDPELVGHVVAEGYPPERERELALRLAEQRCRLRPPPSSQEARRREAGRLFRFLVRRGFHPDVAEAATRGVFPGDAAGGEA